MTTPRLILALLAAVAPATAVAQPFPPELAPPPAPTLTYEGTEVFRWMLHRADIRPLSEDELRRRAFGNGDFSDTLVVLLGNTQFGWAGGQQSSSWAWRAVRGGGAVLLADDQQSQINFDGNLFGNPAQFTGTRVQRQRAGKRFADDPDMPLLDPTDPEDQTGPEWDLFHGERRLDRVVVRTGGTVKLAAAFNRPPLPVLARYPAGVVYADWQAGKMGQQVPFDERAVAVGFAGPHPNTRRPFRFLALASPEVFSNGLMVSTDENGPTDNLEFAARVVRFLSEENGDKRRTKCLLIVKGQVVQNYDELNRLLRPPMPLPKLPPWEQLQPKIIDFGNQILDRVQQSDIPNKLAVGSDPDAPNSRLRWLLAAALVMATLWALFSLVRRVWGARQPTDLAPAPPAGRPPPPPDGSAGLFGRRGKELAARDNLLEPARAACRGLFDATGRPPDPGPRLPKVVIADAVRRPETLRQALRDLWAVAYGRPAAVPAARWAVLAALLSRARAAHADGKWRFAEADQWPPVST